MDINNREPTSRPLPTPNETDGHVIQLFVSLCGVLLALFLVIAVSLPTRQNTLKQLFPNRNASAASNVGDVNGDLVVDVFDLGIVAAHYGETVTASSQPITRAADINSSGKVDVFDVGLLMGLYGRHYEGTPTPSPSAAPTATPTTVTPTAMQTPTPSPTVTTSVQYPAQVLNLTNWKITLPTAGAPEIKQPALATYKHDTWFAVNPGGGVRFRAPVNGGTTSGSSYPRSELREMTNNGSANASWSTSSGTHTMTIDEMITHVPQTKKHVVAGQIHDANDDVIVIRLEMPKLFIDINGSDGPTLDANYTLGKRFKVKFEVSGGQTKIYYNDSTTPSHTLNQSYSGAYFKAGAYTQSNCSTEGSAPCSDANYGEVVIYDVKVEHK